MSDECQVKTIEVWGINVPASPGGRRRWPETIKVKAVEQVALGRTIKEVAIEIGANQSLVAKWTKGTPTFNTHPSFIEVSREENSSGAFPATCLALPQEACQIQIGDAGVTIPVGYPISQLAEVLRAVRMSQ